MKELRLRPSRNLNICQLDHFLLDIQSEKKPSFHVQICGDLTVRRIVVNRAGLSRETVM